MNDRIKEILNFIQKGNMGCTFAAVAAKNPDLYDWGFYEISNFEESMPNFTHSTVSIIFPVDWDKYKVREWCLKNGMVEEVIKKGSFFRRIKRFFKNESLRGMRYFCDGYESWVMYFGKDSHCPTRLTPHPMITFRSKKPIDYFYKVGFKGILHIAQMAIRYSLKSAENLWKTSLKNTKKIVGKTLNEEHGAKTTFILKRKDK